MKRVKKVCSGGLFPHDVECVDLYTLSVADVECVDLYTLSVASGTGRQKKFLGKKVVVEEKNILHINLSLYMYM